MRFFRVRLAHNSQIIAAGGLQVCMSENLLDKADGTPIAEKRRGRGMADQVRRNVFLQAGPFRMASKHRFDGVDTQALAFERDEKGGIGITTEIQVAGDPLQSPVGEKDRSLFIAFADNDRFFPLAINRVAVERQGFRDTHARCCQCLHQGPETKPGESGFAGPRTQGNGRQERFEFIRGEIRHLPPRRPGDSNGAQVENGKLQNIPGVDEKAFHGVHDDGNARLPHAAFGHAGLERNEVVEDNTAEREIADLPRKVRDRFAVGFDGLGGESALGGHVVEESRQTVYYGW